MIAQVPRPVRALRRALRRVRYHSATRRLTPLERVGEMSMLVMLLAGLPATWLLDVAHVSIRWPTSVTGLIYRASDGTQFFETQDQAGRRSRTPDDAELAGRFKVTIRRVERGWPFATTVILHPAQLDVDVFRPRKESRWGVLLSSDPAAAVIGAAIAELGVEHDATHSRLGAWVANTVILSLLLPLATWVAFAMAGRLAAIASRARRNLRRERRARGRCAACGYDVRGNPHGALCPECGNPLH